MDFELLDLCIKHGFKSSIGENGPVVVAPGLYPTSSHKVRIIRLSNGNISLVLHLPECQRPVENFQEFCNILEEQFQSGALICYSESSRQFFLGAITAPEDFQSAVVKFALDCDVAIPLCESVGRFGYWSPAAVKLAYAVPHELHQHVQ